MEYKYCVRKYRLETGVGRKRVVRLAFLTDIHLTDQGPGQEFWKLLDKCRPEGVLLGGDLMVAKEDAQVKGAEKFVGKLTEKYPVWYANGNHERRLLEETETLGKTGKRYFRAISGTKAVRLANQKAEVEIGGCPITIYGLDLPEEYYRKGFRRKGMEGLLRETFGEPEKGRFTILLAHTPRYWREYLDWGASLTLSGHYHGGVCLLGKRRGLITPDYRLLASECCGIRNRGDSSMIVSAGAGEHTVPVRIHNPREITLLEIAFGEA